MEIKVGGRSNGQGLYNASKFLNYIDKLPENKMYGVLKLKGITILTKQEVISKKTIEEQIKKLEDDGYWDFLETRDLEITISILKNLLEGNQ